MDVHRLGYGIVFLIGVIYLVRATPLYTATTQVLLARRESSNRKRLVRLPTLHRFFVHRKPVGNPQIRFAAAKGRYQGAARSAAADAKEPQGTDAKDSRQRRKTSPSSMRINRLRGALAVSRSGQAQVLNISITWEDPTQAAQLANAVADAYVVDQLDARFEAAKRASGWLSDRLVELRQQLRNSEEAVTKFRNEHGLTRSGATVALNDQQLAELNSKLIAARTDAAEKKARVDFLADLAAGKKTLDSLPDSFQSSIRRHGRAAREARGRLAARRPICWRATTAATRRW